MSWRDHAWGGGVVAPLPRPPAAKDYSPAKLVRRRGEKARLYTELVPDVGVCLIVELYVGRDLDVVFGTTVTDVWPGGFVDCLGWTWSDVEPTSVKVRKA